MSLTYQPFAEVPEVKKLAHELHMNISNGERIGSGVVAMRLLAAGVASRGISRWSLLLAGGALLLRSFTGNCAVYREFGIDTRHTANAKRNKVAARARQIWMEEGEPDGKAEEHWNRAERELAAS
jgi:hypothetical protein